MLKAFRAQVLLFNLANLSIACANQHKQKRSADFGRPLNLAAADRLVSNSIYGKFHLQQIFILDCGVERLFPVFLLRLMPGIETE
jgi:hypothetical protein